MAAGLGFKTFAVGEVLSAANVNGYLMQGVLVFADAAARDAAITSPQEGQFAYLKDTNVTTYYTGSAWANLDTTGMTNPMTTTGDMVYSSSGSTPARLGVGSTGQVLTVAGGVPTWATAASGGGMTLLSTTSLSGTSTTTISSISQSYKSLHIIFRQIACSNNSWTLSVRPNNDTTISQTGFRGATNYSQSTGSIKMQNGGYTSSGNDAFTMTLRFDDYTSALSDTCPFQFYGRFYDYSDTTLKGSIGAGGYYGNSAITSLTIETDTGTFNAAATVYIYGVN